MFGLRNSQGSRHGEVGLDENHKKMYRLLCSHYQSDMPLPFAALLLATVARYFHMVGHRSRTSTIDTLGLGSHF